MMGVHPSMVTHWKVVSMASMMLSKLVMPELGPDHFSRQMDSLVLWRSRVREVAEVAVASWSTRRCSVSGGSLLYKTFYGTQ